jgi:acetyl esterase/lipase
MRGSRAQRGSPSRVRAALATALGFAALLAAAAVARAQNPSQPQQPSQPSQPQRPVPVQGTGSLPAPARPAPTPEQMATLPSVLHLPGEDAAVVRRDVVYGTVAGKPLHFDLYLPPGAAATPRAGIVFVSGASDTRDWGIYRSYGRLAAAQGFAGIVYEKRYERGQVLEGVADTEMLLDWLREHARAQGVDPGRIVLWAFSGGGILLGAGIDARRPEVRALIGFYPALDYSQYFAMYPDSLRARVKAKASPADILQSRPAALPPTLIARAGLDDPLLNSGIMRFLRLALDGGRPIELINVAEGRHAFDALDDTEESRRAIRRGFEFAKEQTEPVKSP